MSHAYLTVSIIPAPKSDHGFFLTPLAELFSPQFSFNVFYLSIKMNKFYIIVPAESSLPQTNLIFYSKEMLI